ncbi:MAG: hypothetical protein IPH78_14990 [Bacteroidetes bacterium]|nr:hypothetical protein [Bacteroidota bacterium]
MKNVPHFWMMAMAATLLMFSCGSKPEAAGDAAATTGSHRGSSKQPRPSLCLQPGPPAKAARSI